MPQMDQGFVDWLLESETPSIRYKALRRLMGRSEGDPEVQRAKGEIMHGGPVPAILNGQASDGHWRHESSYYTPKYTSSHWSMMLLTELDANGNDPRLQAGAASMLIRTQTRKKKDSVAGPIQGLGCFWGNLLRYALHCGFSEDPRLHAVVTRLVREGLTSEWRCKYNHELPCAWGAARALWGLAALPQEQRTPEVEEAIESGLTFLLEAHSLVDADHPTTGKIHPLWFRLNFPLFYQTDILFVLRVLAELRALRRTGAAPALSWLRGRRKASGRWRGSSPYRQRTWPELGDKEDADRWVSLQAAMILGAA